MHGECGETRKSKSVSPHVSRHGSISVSLRCFVIWLEEISFARKANRTRFKGQTVRLRKKGKKYIVSTVGESKYSLCFFSFLHISFLSLLCFSLAYTVSLFGRGSLSEVVLILSLWPPLCCSLIFDLKSCLDMLTMSTGSNSMNDFDRRSSSSPNQPPSSIKQQPFSPPPYHPLTNGFFANHHLHHQHQHHSSHERSTPSPDNDEISPLPNKLAESSSTSNLVPGSAASGG